MSNCLGGKKFHYWNSFGKDIRMRKTKMSMFNMIFGDHSGQIALVMENGIDPRSVGRFRDAWLEKDEEGTPILAVYTRNGGGNRESYAEQIAAMQAHPLYVEDADDEFDSTYATFRFRLSDGFVAKANEAVPTWRQALLPRQSMDEKWQEALRELEVNGPTPALLAVADQLKAALEDPNSGPKIIEV
jgi:hypothetical protein